MSICQCRNISVELSVAYINDVIHRVPIVPHKNIHGSVQFDEISNNPGSIVIISCDTFDIQPTVDVTDNTKRVEKKTQDK